MFLKQDAFYQEEIKKSRFMTFLHRASTEEEARSFFASIKKQYPDATHHCTALKIGSIMRSNDDGEPSGTAGRPMLDVLTGSEADEIAAVVVRYFGGTLLGKGGLVRAYSSGVRHALETAVFSRKIAAGLYQMNADYSLSAKAEAWLRKNAIDVQCDYMEEAVYTFFCTFDPSEQLAAISSGKLVPVLIEMTEIEAASDMEETC